MQTVHASERAWAFQNARGLADQWWREFRGQQTEPWRERFVSSHLPFGRVQFGPEDRMLPMPRYIQSQLDSCERMLGGISLLALAFKRTR